MPTGEIQTDAIVRDAFAAGKQVFVPYLHRSPLQSTDTPVRVMDMVGLKNVQDYESLQRDRWGIPSVDPSSVHERQRILGGPDAHGSEMATLDLILMPGVAFGVDDETGAIRRVGHGKGYYDFFIYRYLNKPAAKSLDTHGPVLLYGLALTEQFFPADPQGEKVPAGPMDEPLHGVLLGNGEIKVAKNSCMDLQPP